MTTERTFPKLEALEAAARSKGRLAVAVAYPCSTDSLAAAISAYGEGLIDPVFVGPRRRIEACANALQAGLERFRFVEAEDDPIVSSRIAVALAGAGEVNALMKGSQHTDELLSAVVSRDANLRTSRRMSHVFWFDLPAYHKPLMVTDAVVNMAPSLKDKVDILANAIGFSHAIGIASPKIALLSAIEMVNPDLASSVDAAALSKMADRGQISGAVIDGPLAFDNAISAASAATKGISSPVAGEPDILMVPNLDVGNVLYKSFIYMAGAECAGVVLGARVPIILTSRSDSRRARIASCALAQLSLP
ncbi:MAG: bifunctional enoyl-CoA hydratase/phosphate acetyltransferase [Bradyrhizobium sp.]|uniref:bifunctional enoyl-CoA hydratase/phosphate acetyltransferase n=1 Tax=Bradyrhizobium sp. TaxID=376 RepID=UPI001209EA49|nr:bifunctional enoyl-CoA hydratase/phosphate acetyltransferase [Bradyrhizobium sp.]THD70390.1 MAG: bifunctional enoyl-CoA hydratase/phosphate acetyltransferase [Bradyrhizobium sp.]